MSYRDGSRSWKSKKRQARLFDGDEEDYQATPPTALELSSKLAGTDAIVKEFFFNLSANTRRGILDQYERQYGRGKRQYAEKAVENWKAGRTAMSGKIAARLFGLLPPYMPASRRQQIVAALWQEYSPESRHDFIVGWNCNSTVVVETIKEALLTSAVPLSIPDHLVEEFAWLANDDVQVQQDLLYYLQIQEAGLIVSDAESRIPLLLMAAHDQLGLVKSFQQTYSLGKHTVVLHFDASEEGIRAGRPFLRYQYERRKEGCLATVLLLLIILCIGGITAAM